MNASKASVTSRPLNAATAVLKPIVPKTFVPLNHCLEVFIGLLKGKNFGKLLVRVARDK